AEALVSLDEKRGGATIKKYSSMKSDEEDALITREFSEPVSISKFIKAIDGETSSKISDDHQLFGYTIINSKKAIMSFSAADFLKIFGWSTERALIFTDITYGRSPMIAIRVHPMKPAAIVYHKPAAVDPLAQKLAEADNIPLIITRLEMNDLIKRLDGL
ncbi:MAG: transcriptional regulator, partial [Candidatus Thermoplasmatota archaeon]|nr:transcriptional regulator [Candidatus Thermoplasmatota archaeon]